MVNLLTFVVHAQENVARRLARVKVKPMRCGWEVFKTNQFDKNMKILLRSGVKKDLIDTAVEDLLKWVCGESPLPARYNLHKLKGKLKDVWDIHIKHDLVLIFKLDSENKRIYLINIGPHSEVFR